MHAGCAGMLALVLLLAASPAARADRRLMGNSATETTTTSSPPQPIFKAGTNGCPINSYDYCNYTYGNSTTRCPSCAACKTIDGFGENVQACRLPYKLNGIVLDSDICPNSTLSTPVYANSDSSSERAIGTLITYRTAQGWLIATVRLDCPWLMWFSYNGKMPATSVTPVQTNLVSATAMTRRRRLAASSGSTSTICPSLTTDGTILYGKGNGQYQNGREDARSTLSLTYKSTKTTVVAQIPMYRYQNNGDGSNNNEDNGGDGWYSCYTFMHQMKVSTTCENVKNSLISLTLPLVFKVVSDGMKCSVASVETTVKTGPDTPISCLDTTDNHCTPSPPPPLPPSPSQSPTLSPSPSQSPSPSASPSPSPSPMASPSPSPSASPSPSPTPSPSPSVDPSPSPTPSPSPSAEPSPTPSSSPSTWPSPEPSYPSPSPQPNTLPPTNLTDPDGKGKCYNQYDQDGNILKVTCIYIEIPPDSAVTVDPQGNLVTSSGVNNTEDIAKEEGKDGSLKEPPMAPSPSPSPSSSPSLVPSLEPPSPTPSLAPPSSAPPPMPPILSPLDERAKDRPIIVFDTGEDDPVRNYENPPVVPDTTGSSFGVDSPALEGPGTFTPKISTGSSTALGSDKGLTVGGTAEDLPTNSSDSSSSPAPSAEPSPTPTPSPSAEPSPTPSPTPSLSPSPSPSTEPSPSMCDCGDSLNPSGLCTGNRIPLHYYSRTTSTLIGTTCIDEPRIDNTTGAFVLPICFRRTCVTNNSLDADTIDLIAPNVTLPAQYQQPSVGVALTLLRPNCVLEAWAEGFPVQEDKYNSLLFNEADTVVTPGGGLAKFTAHLSAQPHCDDRSAVFMLNVMPLQLVDTVYNMCPKHAIPDKINGNTDCPAGKVMVFLDIMDGNWTKDPSFSTVKQCVDPANYDMFGGEMAISYCWSFGQMPDPFAIHPFRVRMPNVTYYNIQRMPGGKWDTRVNKPIDRGVTVSLTVKTTKDEVISISESGTYTLPSTGIYSVDLEILVPVGLDDQSVSVQMFGPPNPPPPTELCPCPKDLPADGECPGNTAMLTASLVADPNVTQRGCVPSPYWDAAKGELMFSHCWRYLCLDSRFQKQDYFLDLEFTDKYNVAEVPAGQHRLDWFKPKVVDMFLKFKYNDQPNLDDYAQYSSRNGQSQYITVPTGGIRQMGVRFKIPYNMIYDTNSGSVNLNTDVSRLVPPPPPPLAITNYSYTVNRTGTVLKSQIFVSELVNSSRLDLGAMTNFSSDIQSQIESYIMTSDVAFPDYGLVKSCTPTDVQSVLNMVASKYGVSPDLLSASCQYNYVKPSSVSTSSARRRRGLLQTTTANGTNVCKPRISLTITLPLDAPLNGDMSGALAAATTAANAVYTALGNDACYVPTGAESAIGTLVTFTTSNPLATCEYLLQAFASSNNLTTDIVRTFNCGDYEPKKPYPVGLIILWSVIGAVGLVGIILGVVLLVAWRRRRSSNLLMIDADTSNVFKRPHSPNNKVSPREVFPKGGVAEGLDRPDTPTRRIYANSAGSAVPPVAGNHARIMAWRDPEA
ncbi:hypothetical protein Vretimale_17931 [Volvox reticuliferus]|uniref:Uncharacterized protein n=1 Tax=Volvox reticuliferus TaxID=1737510 RepID=A0A8J4GW93_9CHLO|nr:hypothetical protein Vretifemale_17681 [Volvox reticuliferus]GIM15121.1 hypothetical protein Vretimale_17931 [Volvox reticuliferus]